MSHTEIRRTKKQEREEREKETRDEQRGKPNAVEERCSYKRARERTKREDGVTKTGNDEEEH